jgi:hypothetical protein
MPFDRTTFTAVAQAPIATDTDLLLGLLRDYGIVSTRDAEPRAAVADPDALEAVLRRFLDGLASLGATAVLKVDNASALSVAVLDRIHALAALESRGQPLLCVEMDGRRLPLFSTAERFRVPLATGIAVAVFACALAVGVTALAYARLGY